jgi:hypothetical protein
MPHESTSSVFVPDAGPAACARRSDDTDASSTRLGASVYVTGARSSATASQHRSDLLCHSRSMPRISKARSNSMESAGNNARSSKTLDCIEDTDNGSTCQRWHRNSNPWNFRGSGVAE